MVPGCKVSVRLSEVRSEIVSVRLFTFGSGAGGSGGQEYHKRRHISHNITARLWTRSCNTFGWRRRSVSESHAGMNRKWTNTQKLN